MYAAQLSQASYPCGIFSDTSRLNLLTRKGSNDHACKVLSLQVKPGVGEGGGGGVEGDTKKTK